MIMMCVCVCLVCLGFISCSFTVCRLCFECRRWSFVWPGSTSVVCLTPNQRSAAKLVKTVLCLLTSRVNIFCFKMSLFKYMSVTVLSCEWQFVFQSMLIDVTRCDVLFVVYLHCFQTCIMLQQTFATLYATLKLVCVLESEWICSGQVSYCC